MSSLHISVEAEEIFKILGFPITNSFLCTLILTSLLIFTAVWYSNQEEKKSPPKVKIFIDMILEGLLKFFESVAGKKGRLFFPLLATFFIFIMLANWSGLLPGMGSIGIKTIHHGKEFFIPFFRGPTADLNTTIALAVVSVAGAQIYGIKSLGLKAHLNKFFSTNPLYLFIGILELASEFSKIISYSFRLFGNIFAGEVLLAVMGFLIPYLAPLPFLGLEVFVGFIQALVFTMLSLVFWTIASEHHNNNENHNKGRKNENSSVLAKEADNKGGG